MPYWLTLYNLNRTPTGKYLHVYSHCLHTKTHWQSADVQYCPLLASILLLSLIRLPSIWRQCRQDLTSHRATLQQPSSSIAFIIIRPNHHRHQVRLYHCHLCPCACGYFFSSAWSNTQSRSTFCLLPPGTSLIGPRHRHLNTFTRTLLLPLHTWIAPKSVSSLEASLLHFPLTHRPFAVQIIEQCNWAKGMFIFLFLIFSREETNYFPFYCYNHLLQHLLHKWEDVRYLFLVVNWWIPN